ncbi:hypothetical protein DFH09DRAFT_1339171 [Mycena vulgaris]|nr:hypothetical protein DFH09DRAFT_1339171 [Mycena vulgaris]
MFSAIPLPNRVLKTHALATHMLNFNNAHTIYDPDYRPPTFRRDEPSRTATTAIPLERKRGHGEKGGDEPPSKRAKKIETAAKEPAQKPKKMPKKASALQLLKSAYRNGLISVSEGAGKHIDALIAELDEQHYGFTELNVEMLRFNDDEF